MKKPKEENSETTEITNDLFEKRIILINKDIDEESVGEWVGRLLLLDLKNQKPILLFVHTFGGNAYSAYGLVDVIQHCKSPIITVCNGLAASGGSLILAAGTKRYATPQSEIMMHQSWSEYGTLTHSELQNEAEVSKRLYNKMCDFYQSVSLMSKTQVQKYLAKDSYMSAQTAKELGLIDDIGWNVAEWLK